MSSHNYGNVITLDNVTVMYSSLDAPDRFAPDTHNITVSLSQDQYDTLRACGTKLNGVKNPHTVRDNPDHEYNGLISLKCKSKAAIKDGLMRHPRAVADGIDPNSKIMSSDTVSLQIKPVTWGSGPAQGSTSFLLDGIRLDVIGPRDFLGTNKGWGWDEDSMNALDQSDVTPNDDPTEDSDTTPVPATNNSDVPF